MDNGKKTTTVHILLLEDDTAHQDIISRAFRDDPEPFRLSVAGTLKKAREIIDHDPPDLIISDWILPDGKGLDILPRTDGRVTIPLIIMTSYGDEHLAVEIMKSGAIDYVVKSATVFRDLPHIARRALRNWDNIRQRHLAEAAAVESQKRLADILNFLPDAMLAIDNEGRVIAWNDAIERMTGVSAGEMLGKGDYEYSLPFYGERRPIIIDLLRSEHSEIEKKYDYVHRESDRLTSEVFSPLLFEGKGAYLWGTATPLYDADNNRIGAVEVIRDITERRLAEETLKKREATLEILMNAPHDTIALLDRQGVIININESGACRLGRTVPEVLGRSAYDLLPADLARARKEYIDRVFATGEPAGFEDERNGMCLHNEVYPVFRPDHVIIEQVAIFTRDITDQKKTKLALEKSESRFRHVSDLISDFAFSCIRPEAGTYSIDWVSGAVTRITGFSENEILSMGCWRGIVVEAYQPIFDKEITGLPPGRSTRCELKIRAKDGAEKWLECFAECIPAPAHPQFHRLYGGCQDITVRKNAELALQESEIRFKDLFNNMNAGVIIYEMTPDGSDFTVRDLNKAVETIEQVKREEIINKSIFHVFPGVVEFGLFAVLQRVAGTGIAEAHPVSLYQDKRISGWRENYVYKLPSGEIVALYEDVTEKKQAEALRESYELRLNSAMEIGSMAWWEMDLPDGAVRFDDRKATMIGYPPAQFRHYTDFTALLHPDDFELAMAAMRAHLEGRESRYHLDYRIRASAGDYRWFRDVGGITRRHPDGTPATVTGIIIDITGNKQAEEQLRTTETRFSALIQNSSDIIRILDQDGRIVYESPSSERILGYPTGYLINRDPLEYVHPDDIGRVKKDLRDVMDRKNPGTPTEFRIRKSDGEHIWVDSVGINLLDVQGVNGIVITTRPIQKRKEAEQALYESEERLRLALEGAGAAYWDWDLKTGKAIFSDRFYTMIGYTPGEFPSTYDGWTALIHPDDRDRVLPDLTKQIREKSPICEIEYRLRTKDDSWTWVLARGKIADTDEAGNPTRLTGVNIDITDRRLMESEIRSLNTVLEQRVKDRTEALSQVNEALEEENAQRLDAEGKLRASYDEKVLLLKEIHHRVKNNLQIIASLLNLQSRYIKDESTLAAIRESQNRVKAMALVHEKLYRSEDISHIDLEEYIQYLANGLFQFYDAKVQGIRFRLEIKNVEVDINLAIPLGLVINELISNSLKYAFPEGRKGEISLTLHKEGHDLNIQFRDDGIGIPADLDWKNTQSLGLRLVNTLVDQMDGTIELDRTAGTQFSFTVHEKDQRSP